MYTGAAVGAVAAIVGSVATHNVTFYTYKSTSANTATVHTANSLVAGIVAAVIVTGLWLWMAWKTGAGRSWARVLSTVFFGFACLQLLGAVVNIGGSGGRILALVLMLVEWSVALAALIQLWQRESGDFFTMAKQARLYRA
jgi:ABC-type transport system involved in cytochrome bd biosynthesis fused ATPase/permease subunit